MRTLLKYFIRQLARVVHYTQARIGAVGSQPLIRREIQALKQEIGQVMPQNPALSGFKVYSQTDEDGIIDEILRRLLETVRTRTFVEIGCGNGLENNTHYLALQGYRGVWIDGDSANIAQIRQALPANALVSRLKVIRRFIDVDNIGETIDEACAFIGTKEPDVFSLDIDGNDLFVLKVAITRFAPRLIVAEYNPKFPPPVSVSIRYDKTHTWASDDYFGASLQAFCDALSGYLPVCCNLSGSNVFFVRSDLSEAFARYSIAQLYQPSRPELRHLMAASPATFRWLRDALERD